MNQKVKSAKRAAYLREVNKINFNSPMYQVLYAMAKKGKMKALNSDLTERILKRTLDFRTKETVWKLQENWKKQPYKVQRCTLCHLEIPGGQDVMMMHLNTHFGNYTEHRNRIEQIETHPYKYV